MKSTLVLIVITFASITLFTSCARAQGLKIGVLPYADATASGAANLGDTLGRLTQAEIVYSTQLEGRCLQISSGLRPEQLDSEKVIALGKEGDVDVVVMGTVLEAHAEESAQSASPPRAIFGQSITGNVHSWKATVTLQADVYEVATGKKLDSLRATQTQTDTKVGGGAATSLGSMDSDTAAFQSSTLGKALQKTISDLVKHLNSDTSKVMPYAAERAPGSQGGGSMALEQRQRTSRSGRMEVR